MLTKIKKELNNLADSKKAKILQGFFKTGLGEYGHGDVFLGISVPDSRNVAKRYKNIKLKDAENLLSSKIHEERLVALLILVEKFKSGDEKTKKEIVDFYLKNTKYINNWDLVDLSADKVLGEYLFDKDKSILYKLAKSNNLWERRIAIVSTFAFIRRNNFEDALEISKILINDKHDLMHKAVGWMLREVGKRDQDVEEEFLIKHYKKMPRTMLRYSIEKFDNNKKEIYMKKL